MTVRDVDGTTRTAPSATHGQKKRWCARYVDDDGQEHTMAFAKADAQQWLETEVTAAFATGTYVAPAAGRVTVADIYASWCSAQAHISAKTAASRRSVWGSRAGSHWADMSVIIVRTAAVRAWVGRSARPSNDKARRFDSRRTRGCGGARWRHSGCRTSTCCAVG